MHVWVVERLAAGEWESLDVAYPTRHQARADLAWWRRTYPNYDKVRIRKYIPEPTVEDFDRWFEGKYGPRHHYPEFRKTSDDEIQRMLSRHQLWETFQRIEIERTHRNEWDSKKRVANMTRWASEKGFEI